MNTDLRKLTGNDTRIRWTGNVRPAKQTGAVARLLRSFRVVRLEAKR